MTPNRPVVAPPIAAQAGTTAAATVTAGEAVVSRKAVAAAVNSP